jgi:carbon-monoxide dehydrogenase large subunit
VSIDGALHAVVVRSPYAHARIELLDTGQARAMPGVMLVLTASDILQSGIGSLGVAVRPESEDGQPCIAPPRPLLADGKVRYTGEPIAFIVAQTPSQALDAAEAVVLEVETLPAVVDADAALTPGAPTIYDEAPDNRLGSFTIGDRTATDMAMAQAAHVVELSLVNNRIVVASMEPRNAIGDYDASTGRYTLTTSSQGAHVIRDALAGPVLGVEASKLRVMTPDVGGGFGMKAIPYPEQGLVLVAAKITGQPVRWQSTRSEAFLSDTQGRDNLSTARLALDADGRMLGLDIHTRAGVGGCLSGFGAYSATMGGPPLGPGVYAIPTMHGRVDLAFTNVAPIDAYRGAGRPEAAYLIERLVDYAARELEMDPIALRRLNMIPPTAMPYTTATGVPYDSGEFEAAMDAALCLADWDGAAERKKRAAERGMLRGIGLAFYIERTGGIPQEFAHIALNADGGVDVSVGTQSSGQGHETVFTQLVAERLQVDPERIRILTGDTDHPLQGGLGTVASRSMVHGGGAISQASDTILVQARKLAADELEVAEADLHFQDATFTILGTDRAVSLSTLVERSGGLEAAETYNLNDGTFPNGGHVCEIEIDPETGCIEVVNYAVVDDFGYVLNPKLLEGQIHGGIAQGLGQAMMEHTLYDPLSGQLLSGSFMDYALPRADDLPFFDIATRDIPCTTNPMGVKGAGEAGAIGAPPALVNAAVDALAQLGVRHLDMPLTPVRVWTAIQAAKTASQ